MHTSTTTSTTTRTSARTTARPAVRLAAPLGALGLVLAAAGPAAAHVSVEPTSTTAGSYTLLTFGVPHGCDGSATTRVAIALPESIVTVTPTRNPYWEVEKVMEELDEPVEGAHGEEYTERVAQVVYTTDTPLPDGQRDAFELSLRLPEDAAGTRLAFPTVQTCEQGEAAWTEVVAEGEEEPEHPAPAFTVTDAEDAGGHAGHDHAEEESSAVADAGDDGGSEEAATAAAPVDGDSGPDGLAIAGLVAGLLGLLAGGAALVGSRRKA